MANKNDISLGSIDAVELPSDLADESAEESIYQVEEATTHSEHKLAEANKTTLNLAKQKIRTLEIENNDLAMLGPHRRIYSWWILGFVIVFVILSLSILVLSSLQLSIPNPPNEVEYRSILIISDKVLMMLLGTTAAQVVGLLYVVVKWLFFKKEENPKNQ